MASPAPARNSGSFAHKLHIGVRQAYWNDVLFEHHRLVQLHKSHINAEVCRTILWVYLYQKKSQEIEKYTSYEAESLKCIGIRSAYD
jgi:hypothetical protein